MLAEDEWILHAATQDLPCLAEVKLLPLRLFDSELAARLVGLPRVALGTLIEEAFGLTLRKEHSAADWSRRPLPPEWLNYAALDVELLIDLRAWLVDKLEAAGKTEWARQEFAHLVERAAVVPPPRQDPWRRTSGLHAVHSPRALAVVRELWQVRDELASSLDRAPGKILPDRHQRPGRAPERPRGEAAGHGGPCGGSRVLLAGAGSLPRTLAGGAGSCCRPDARPTAPQAGGARGAPTDQNVGAAQTRGGRAVGCGPARRDRAGRQA